MTEEEKVRTIWKILNDLGIGDSPCFTDEEWAGLCEEAPMTFETFISALEKCAEGNYVECYFNLLEQFPEYGNQLDNYFEEKHGIEQMTPAKIEEYYFRFKQRLLD